MTTIVCQPFTIKVRQHVAGVDIRQFLTYVPFCPIMRYKLRKEIKHG